MAKINQNILPDRYRLEATNNVPRQTSTARAPSCAKRLSVRTIMSAPPTKSSARNQKSVPLPPHNRCAPSPFAKTAKSPSCAIATKAAKAPLLYKTLKWRVIVPLHRVRHWFISSMFGKPLPTAVSSKCNLRCLTKKSGLLSHNEILFVQQICEKIH